MAEAWLSGHGIAADPGVTKDNIASWIVEKDTSVLKIETLWESRVCECQQLRARGRPVTVLDEG